MKLHYARGSPYVRKVMVAAHECGLADRLEFMTTTPESIVGDVAGDNPLGRIPTLVTDDGERIFDSLAICEYFDWLAPAGLIPPPGPARWAALRRHAIGHGLIDAAIALLHEGRRAPKEQSSSWTDKRREETLRALDALEAEAAGLPNGANIGTIASACALGYLDYRFADERWRDGRDALAAWYADFAARPSMCNTAPEASP